MSSSPRADDQHVARAAPARRRLLELLQDGAAHDARHLAEATGLHVTTVRFHLQILERAGLVSSRSDPQGRSGRPRTVYTATGADEADLLRRDLAAYEDLTDALATHLSDRSDGPSRAAEQAGASWAARLGPTAGPVPTAADAATRVGQMCAQLGFAPELTPTDGDRWRIELRACPYRSVARAHPDVVCALHRGLIRGTLEQAGFPQLGSTLEPFVEPELCVAHLGAPP